MFENLFLLGVMGIFLCLIMRLKCIIGHLKIHICHLFVGEFPEEMFSSLKVFVLNIIKIHSKLFKRHSNFQIK